MGVAKVVGEAWPGLVPASSEMTTQAESRSRLQAVSWEAAGKFRLTVMGKDGLLSKCAPKEELKYVAFLEKGGAPPDQILCDFPG